MNKKCDGCGDNTSRKELGRKVRGDYLCKKCKLERRLEHREKTIEEEGIGGDLRDLRNKIYREKEYGKIAYRKKVGRPVRKYNTDKEAPVPKGSIRKKPKYRQESYLGFQESQILFKILMRRGLDYDEAKDKIKEIKTELKNTREELKKKNKSEEEITQKINLKLEELYNY